eukprot:9207109-Lingulodinium_polyedra.AAC.1
MDARRLRRQAEREKQKALAVFALNGPGHFLPAAQAPAEPIQELAAMVPAEPFLEPAQGQTSVAIAPALSPQ